MPKKKVSPSLIVGGMALVGLAAGVATMAGAQIATTPTSTPITPVVKTQTVDTPEPGDVADTPGVTEPKTHNHAPLGGDGVVSGINGATIVMAEESNEGGTYTIDASKANVTNNGVAGSLSDIKVGQKIFVLGAISGTNVAATSISLGHPGEHGDKANDTDGTSAKETGESASSSDASGE